VVSKWRYNIAEMGAVGMGYRLAARFLSGGEGFEYLVRPVDATNTARYVTPVIFDDMLQFVFTIRPVVGNFPYGKDVEPDRLT